ncbi:START domain-containing protein [Cocleimonas sp. KMM 6892]|uniref:START domain-containing protein n=1 Tax=unclassified Cocleimonas TaxID=2639732 RepID=UPI002DBA988F|nr:MULTISPECIES: START domain-containing protein [unclassified Cocleimonas]MEB8432075.1 START domain-containing protein [Cocleimonas sp. KMM 6892]MEC4714839.1 START domain-containing protein [Cocleimonas sp. KMM 6895]MEC4744347.1 START domain-containing protein [Cocleimonas sp. KMM 6896]
MIKNYTKHGFLFSMLLIFSVPIFATQDNWYLEKEEDNIQVFVSKTKGSPLKSFRGVVTVDSSVNSVLSVIADTSSYPRWVHNCKSAKTIKRVSETEIYNHIVTDMPWPVIDRDSVVQSVKTQNKTSNQITITFVSKPAMIEKLPKTVRITKMQGLWELTPLQNGKLKILYQMSVDPGGNIPKWLVNSLAVDIPYHTLNNLRRIAKEDKYKKASK